jgi:membrane peptidoglycan carboxypeptidase
VSTIRRWSPFRPHPEPSRRLRQPRPAAVLEAPADGALSPSIGAPGIESDAATTLVRGRVRRPVPRWAVLTVVLLALVAAALVEARTSGLQARLFSAIDGGMRVTVEPGPSPRLAAPETGPYDVRLGYSKAPAFTARLQRAGFRIDSQARISPRLEQAIGHGIFPIYREKSQAGLRVVDGQGHVIYGVQYPERIYGSFDAIPPAVVSALLFIEDRQLLDERRPFLNPAINWARLGRAVAVDALVHIGHEGRVIGASTLATQIEKFRHSPDGRTASAREKLRQMVSASLRTYRGGPRTLPARRQIAVDYLNSMPLAATPDHGEVHGLDDGLRAWFGADLPAINEALSDESRPVGAVRAKAYKRVLSLILAARRPSYYLVENRAALEDFTDSYLRVLAAAGVIDADLRDAAIAQRLDFRTRSATAVDFTERKGANLVRSRLAGLLGVPALYDLDRLDLTARSTLSEPAQEAVTRILDSLKDPKTVKALGLTGFHLLDERGDPARVIYSFTLYERGAGANLVRVQTDSLDQPLDLNAGARLDLGSSAKLRALISYLEVVAELHARFSGESAQALRATEVHRRDQLTAWAVDYLARATDRRLLPMLEAAMDRRYSANPGGGFVTGGGLQVFQNFEPEHDVRIMTVRDGFRNSVNLVFIRLMRDVVTYYLYRAPESIGRIVENPTDPRREAYLMRFADREGSEFIRQFYRKYHGKSPAEAFDLLLGGVRPTPYRLATALRSANPEASVDTLRAVLAARVPDHPLSEADVQRLYKKYAPDAFSLMDRGYLARVHPLELWLVDYLRRHPSASLADVLQASAAERQEVYRWLFKTSRRNAQDKRIASLLEMEAFLEIQKGWERLGYPFASMTPSLASAIGASGDRPAALAELMGILVNDGVRYPTVLLDQVHLASGTPWETHASHGASDGQAVLPPEIAAVARGALGDVVTQGTARSLQEFLKKDGGRHVVGGKTGTGDHRFDTYAPGRRLISSRVVNRAATFVFQIDDRFFGTVTAWVPGREAARYQFTSALPVRLLGHLMPVLAPVLDAPAGSVVARAALAPAAR